MNDQLARCYATLDLEPGAPAREIKEAYLDLVKVWHPDRYHGESPRLQRKAEDKLKAINAAYEQLRCQSSTFCPVDGPPKPCQPDVRAGQELKPVSFGTSWGYVDSDARLIIPPRFQSACPFSEGVALVRESHRFGFIDARGEYAIYPEFSQARSFSEGLAAVVLSVHWGFIDHQNRLCVNPLYEACSDFSNGLAAVCWRGRWGYIDRSGAFVIRPRFEGARPFSGEWGEVRIDEKWAKINRAGDVFFNGEPVLLAQ